MTHFPKMSAHSQTKTTNYSKAIHDTHHYISKRWVKCGLPESVFITVLLPLKLKVGFYGCGLDCIQSTTNSLPNAQAELRKSAQPLAPLTSVQKVQSWISTPDFEFDHDPFNSFENTRRGVIGKFEPGTFNY